MLKSGVGVGVTVAVMVGSGVSVGGGCVEVAVIVAVGVGVSCVERSAHPLTTDPTSRRNTNFFSISIAHERDKDFGAFLIMPYKRIRNRIDLNTFGLNLYIVQECRDRRGDWIYPIKKPVVFDWFSESAFCLALVGWLWVTNGWIWSLAEWYSQ